MHVAFLPCPWLQRLCARARARFVQQSRSKISQQHCNGNRTSSRQLTFLPPSFAFAHLSEVRWVGTVCVLIALDVSASAAHPIAWLSQQFP